MISVLSTMPDPKNYKIFNIVKDYTIDKNFICIGITGAGGAGKTTFAKNLVNYFGSKNSLTIDLDDYLISREERGRLGLTGYHPRANKLNLIREHILLLKQGAQIEKPIYNHGDGTNKSIEIVKSLPVMIFEGVTTLYPQLDDLYDFSIFLDALEETQIKSRIKRDVNERGYTLEEALELYENLKPHYVKYVLPTQKKATIISEVGIDYVIHPKV